MNEQLEFPFIHTAKRREQLLLEVEFGKRRNSVLLAALLREIAKYPPGECYPSQATLAKAFKVNKQTIYRALIALGEFDLVVTQLRSRSFHDGTKTVNHYFINWTALEQRVADQTRTQEASPKPEAIRQLAVVPTDTTVEATDTTVSPDRYDSCAAPIRQLAPTDTTASCRTIDLIEKQIDQTTTNGGAVVVGGFEFVSLGEHDPTWTASETERIGEELRTARMHAPNVLRAIETVKNWHWSVMDVQAHIDYWRDSGLGIRALANWLLHDGSAPEEILTKRRLQQLRSQAEVVEPCATVATVSREKSAQRWRETIEREGNAKRSPRWVILANVAMKLEREQFPEFVTEEERLAHCVLERFEAMAKQHQHNPRLKAELKRLALEVNDMPVSQVESQLGELEQRTADDCSDESSTENFEAGTEAEKEQLCKR